MAFGSLLSYVTLLYLSCNICGYCRNLTPLDSFSFNSPEDDIVSDDDMFEVMEAKYNYIQDKDDLLPTITNLMSFLTLICESITCLIVADNFRRNNLHRSDIPFVVRTPTPLVHRKVVISGNGKYQVILSPFRDRFKNISLPQYPQYFPCPISKYLVGLEAVNYERDICIRINLAQYTFQTKPFNLQIHLLIFPLEYITQPNIMHPKAVHYEIRNSLFKTPPHSPLNIIVELTQTKSPFTQFNVLSYWLHTLKLASPSHYMHDIILRFGVSTIEISILPEFEPSGEIETVEVFQICHYCPNLKKEFGNVIRTNLKSLKLEAVSQEAFALMNSKVVWQADISSFMDNLLTLTMIRLTSCLIVSFEKLWFQIFSKKSFPEKIAVAHSQVLLSTLGNFTFKATYPGEKRTSCMTKKFTHFMATLKQEKYAEQSFIFPYYSQDYLTTLKFIGCGSQGVSSLAYQELTNVFDKWVWLCIAGTIFLTSGFSEAQSCKNNLLSTFKMLVEQGNPFTSATLNKKSLRSAFGFLLLMGIVLSNGYKNTNVYKMIQHRTPKLYKYFDELLRDNFNIYSRSSHIFLNPSPAREDLGFEEIDVIVGDQKVMLLSEVRSFLREQDFVSTDRNNISIMAQKLQDLVSILPEVKYNFTEYLHKYVLSKLEGLKLWESDEMISEHYPEMQNMEMERLQTSLQNCQKVALILPNHMCQQMQNMLINENIMHLIFLGEETYSVVRYMFHVMGLVPPHLIQRIHRMSETGIWQWWIQILGERNLKGAMPVPVQAASMHGNIVIIFAVWGCGIGFSLLCLTSEFLKFTLIRTNAFVSKLQCFTNLLVTNICRFIYDMKYLHGSLEF